MSVESTIEAVSAEGLMHVVGGQMAPREEKMPNPSHRDDAMVREGKENIVEGVVLAGGAALALLVAPVPLAALYLGFFLVAGGGAMSGVGLGQVYRGNHPAD
jgi:hypothetical protein